MVKSRVKPMERLVENYVLSTVEGMFKTYRYWRERGYPEGHSVQNACKWGVAQLFAGISSDEKPKYADIFDTIVVIAKSLAEYCRTESPENPVASLQH